MKKNKLLIYTFLCLGATALVAPVVLNTSNGLKKARAAETYNYNYGPTDMTSTSTFKHYSESASGVESTLWVKFTTAENDMFPVKTPWNAWYECENAVTITTAGGETVIKNGLILKTAASTYSISFPNYYWASGQKARCYYEFKAGDKFAIKGTFTTQDDFGNTINTTLNNLIFDYDGNNFAPYRADLVERAKTILNSLKPTMEYSKQYKELVQEGAALMKSLSLKEVTSFDKAKMQLVLSQGRLADGDDMRLAGKNVHISTINTSDINARGALSSQPTGATFLHNAIEWGYYEYPGANPKDNDPSSRAWNNYFRGTKDSKLIKANQTEIPYDSAIVIYKAIQSDDTTFVENDFRACFIFVNWTKPSATDIANLEPGDRYVVEKTGYTLERDNDYYIVEFEGCDLIWSGTYWIDTSLVPNYQTLIQKINDIGEVAYTPECLAKIKAARSFYDGLNENERNYVHVSVLEKLTKAEATYQDLEFQAVAGEVIKKIQAIGNVELTPECKARIDAARKAYDNLNISARAKIDSSIVKILTDAEAKYQDLTDERDAASVVLLINQIGEVTATKECKARIDAARAAYDALNDNAQNKISEEQYLVLFNAEAQYAKLTAASDFIALVDTLNENMTVDQIYSVIIQAKILYEKIEDKSSVAAAKAKLDSYIEKYNSMIGAVNDAHEEATDSGLNIIIVATSLTTAFALAAVLLTKKGAF